ncbi:bifunctional diguanylate cyclase/phosphodiesterase [Pseudogulbenkiania sp. MAI-1]|uniref:putative bifunctional diguanylate cyclase/phosphodiesterase n=1 Tax=Pseudogulbenkiania sp. MAI-1 TaxID=990370 RepID=UPI00045EABF2|nr:diguanylate cyclase [Pseudogulbenkiania sp. MAI-1]
MTETKRAYARPGWLNALSLRQRLLVAPLLALVLIVALIGGFLLTSQRQSLSAVEVSAARLQQMNALAAQFAGLTQLHTELGGLLREPSDPALVKHARLRLAGLVRAAAQLNKSTPAPLAEGGDPGIGQFLLGLTDYERKVSVAAAQLPADPAAARRHFEVADRQFLQLAMLFEPMLRAETRALGQDVERQVSRNQEQLVGWSLAGGGVCIALLGLALLGTRWLSRSLEQQFAALVELGREAGSNLHALGGGDELARLGGVIEAFRMVLGRVRSKEQQLLALNRDLQRAQEELEQRVEERTRALHDSEAWARGLLKAAPDAVIISTRDGRIVMTNARVETLLGYPAEELQGQPFELLVPERLRPALRGWYRHVENGEFAAPDEILSDIHIRCRDGRELPIEVSVSLIPSSQGMLVFSDIRDASWRRQAEKDLRLYAEVIRSTGEAVAIADPEGHIIEVNPAYAVACGAAREELIGKPLFHTTQGLLGAPALRELQHALGESGCWSGELPGRRQDGERFISWVTLNELRNERGRLLHTVWISRDITLLKQGERELQRLAFYDPLTGLANRALFADHLQMALAGARREPGQLAVMYIDLDRFKSVNDTLGHPAGDRLLSEVAGRLRGVVRDADTLARLGGDEFTVLLAELHGEEQALQVAARIIQSVSQPVLLDGQELFVSASVGIAFFPQHGDDADTLCRHADMALYEAKLAGGGQCSLFNREMQQRSSQRLAFGVRLDAALGRNELSLCYRPLSVDGTPMVEALPCWNQPDGSVLMPEDFLGQAEEAGLSQTLNQWMLRQACRDGGDWQQQGRNVSLTVRLSGAGGLQAGLPDLLRDILLQTGLAPSRLTIGIDEGQLMRNPELGRAVLQQLAGLGVSLFMDGFGTSYVSLSQLTRLPLRHLTLDREFLRHLGQEHGRAGLLETLLQLAQLLKLQVVASGVEDEEQQALLRAAGCRLVPVAPADLLLAGDEVPEWLGRQLRRTTSDPA